MKKIRCVHCGMWFLPFGQSAEQMVEAWSWHPCTIEKQRDNLAASLMRAKKLHPTNGGAA
jgi:hypothetical protein